MLPVRFICAMPTDMPSRHLENSAFHAAKTLKAMFLGFGDPFCILELGLVNLRLIHQLDALLFEQAFNTASR